VSHIYFRGQKYFREYASLLSQDFCNFTSLGELKKCKNRDRCVKNNDDFG
jgi:hypothetical protein